MVGSSPTIALRGYLSNTPEGTVKGIEADVTPLLMPGLTVRIGFVYAEGKCSDYPAGPCALEAQTATTAACDLRGTCLASHRASR